MAKEVKAEKTAFFAMPAVGTTLSLLAGLSFLFLLMILPLVGPAAVYGSGSPGAGPVPHLKENYLAFSATLALSIALNILAVVSKLERRKVDGSPLPYFSFALLVILALLLLAFVLGLLSI